MQVMQNHDFFDEEISKVVDCHLESEREYRTIVFNGETGTMLFSKEDAVAIAKEFGLVVYESNANL